MEHTPLALVLLVWRGLNIIRCPPPVGRGTSWQCGGATEADGGPAGGEEPGATQSKRDGEPVLKATSTHVLPLKCCLCLSRPGRERR